MSLRTDALVKSWTSCNLPILPFLAPRAFQPWAAPTTQTRRKHNCSSNLKARSNCDGYKSSKSNRPGQDCLKIGPAAPSRARCTRSFATSVRHDVQPTSKTTRRMHTVSQPALYDFTHQQDPQSSSRPVNLHKNQERAVKEFHDILGTESEEHLKEHWDGILETIRSDTWPNLVLDTIRNQPQHVRKLLAVTKSDRLIGKCLEDLIELFFSPDLEIASALDATQSLTDLDMMWTDIEGVNDVTLKDIYAVVFELLHSQSLSPIRLTQRSIYMMLSYLTDAQLVTFYKGLTDINQYLSFQTLMHFGSRLAKQDESGIEVAVDILKTFKQRGFDFDQPSVMSLCTSILHGFHQLTDSNVVGSKFQELLGIGMKVNVITYNVLLHSATEHGDFETAWKIHDMMIDANAMPDAYTYSILLNDAKWRQDAATLTKTINLIEENGFDGDPYIVTDMLHYSLLLAIRRHETTASKGCRRPLHDFEATIDHGDGNKSFATEMLEKYARYFTLDFVLKLGPGWASQLSDYQDANEPLLQPSLPTLHVMISGLLYGSSALQTKAIYHNFIRLLKSRDKHAMKLAQSDHIWATFLKSLGRHRENLVECSQLVKRMVSLRAELLAERKVRDKEARMAGKIIQHATVDPIPEPNVYIWSILVDALSKNGQMRAAEKILTTMKSRGIEPNEVTWTALAWGYSNSQEAGNVADTIDRMEKSGIEVVAGAQSAMLKIKDRQGLRRALDRLKRLQNSSSHTVASDV